MALLGNTPIRFGPRPLNRPGTPSLTKMNLKLKLKFRESIFFSYFLIKYYFKHWNTFILGGGLVGTVDVEQGLEIDIIEGDTEALEWAFATGTVICKAPRRSKTAISGGSVTFLMAVPVGKSRNIKYNFL